MITEEFMQQVLNKLTSLEQEISDVKSTLGQEISDVKSTLGQEISDVKSALNDTRERVILMENEQGRYLRALGDGYTLMYDKLEPLPSAVETLQEDVSVIKAVVTSHSADINTLKLAK